MSNTAQELHMKRNFLACLLVLGTLLGAWAGTAIDPKTFGLDAAFPAAYVAMVWPLLGDRRCRLAAVCGGSICVALIPFVPVGVPILCAAAAVLVGVRR